MYRVVITPAPGHTDPREKSLQAEIASLGIDGVREVRVADLYFLDGELCDEAVERLGRELLADPVVQRYTWERLTALDSPPPAPKPGWWRWRSCRG